MISEQNDGSILLSVYIQPGASKSEIVGPHNGSLKIRIQSPPIDGKANEALIEFLSGALNISKKSVEITKGHTQRKKVVRITQISKQNLLKSLPQGE